MFAFSSVVMLRGATACGEIEDVTGDAKIFLGTPINLKGIINTQNFGIFLY